MARLSPTGKKALRGVGYVAFGLFVAVLTLYWTLPRGRIKEKIEATLSADPNGGTPGAINLEVILGDLAVTLFTGSGLRATDVVVRTRPINPDDKPARFVLDDVSVKAGLIGLIFGKPSYRFRAHAFEGEVSGRVTSLPTEFALAINAKGIVLTGDKAIAQLVGIPVEGTVSCKIDVHADKGLLSALDGSAEVEIEDAVFGDGKAKLKLSETDPFLKAGITIPRLRLGTITVKIVFDKGKAKLESVHTKSADGEAFVDGNMELRDFFNLSQLHLYVRFRPSEALVKREGTVELMTNQLAGTAKRPDGFFGFQINGPLTALFPVPSPNPPPGVVLGAAPAAAPTPTPTKPPPAGFVSPPPANGDPMQPAPPQPAPTQPPPAPPPSEPEAPQPPGPPPAPTTTLVAPPPARGGVMRVQPPAGEDPPPVPPEHIE